MNIFGEADLSSHLDALLADMRRTIQAEDQNYILNVNEPDYIKHLTTRYQVDPLTIREDALNVTTREQFMRPGNDLRGQPVLRQVITYHLPFSGEPRLLYLTPSNCILWAMEVEIHGNEISFDIVNWRDDPEVIKREADANVKNICRQAAHVAAEVEAYNLILEQRVTDEVRVRKEQLFKHARLLEKLGVPFKSRAEVPETFAIPAPQRKKVIAKPVGSVEPYSSEPTLDDATFRHILQLCQGTGREIERHPSIYTGKCEETLRDHFIMVLSPHFESVTGETFNKEGKTDILIRHEGRNVFVAECKFWRGAKQHADTIDQVLSYLTWRDSKAAILYFVKNKNLAPVLKQVLEETPKHAAYVECRGTPIEGWFEYRFHLLRDETRNVFLTIQCFHFPEDM